MRGTLAGRIGLLALALGATSCDNGGKTPTRPALPTPPPTDWSAGTVLTVVSGEDDAPVSGARVTIAGVPYTSDGSGRVVVEAVAAEGATADVEHPDFLTRQTLVRHAVTRLTLWPNNPTLPGEYTLTLVYTASTLSDSTSIVPLERLPPGVKTLALVPSDALTEDPEVMAAHRQAADYFNAAVGGRTLFSVGGSADMVVSTRVDAEDASCEGVSGRLITRTWTSDHEVTRAQIIFCGERPARLASPIAHELGHVFGLAHSKDRRDLMWPYYSSSDHRGFSEREVRTMNLLYLRRGGNQWPDNDRDAAGSGRGMREFVD